MLQNLRVVKILIIGLAFASVMYAGVGDIDSRVRSDSNVNLISGSKVTEMPYGYYVPAFGKSSLKVIDRKNLQDYGSKKLLIGYGVYDISEENCRYLDVPTADFDIAFDKRVVLNNETYAISRDKVTYQGCLAKTAQYNGYIYAPSSMDDLAMIRKRLGTDKDMWMGYSRLSCAEPYINAEGVEQSFETFLTPIEMCDPLKLFTFNIANSNYWKRVDQTEVHYCPLKINSPDYKRPIKICLPWWRVERTWKIDKKEGIFVYDGEEFDFRYTRYLTDYPQEKRICTVEDTTVLTLAGKYKSQIRARVVDKIIPVQKEINGAVIIENMYSYKIVTKDVLCTAAENVAENDFDTRYQASCREFKYTDTVDYSAIDFKCINNENLVTSSEPSLTDTAPTTYPSTCIQVKKDKYQQTCLSYYDVKKSPICIENIRDNTCLVDECAGYIKDNCVMTDNFSPFKDYDYGYIMIDGFETRIKTKVDKKVNVYDCPHPSRPLDRCLERMDVQVFPAHCPGSKCDDLKICLTGKVQTHEECIEKYPCEKHYGSVDNVIRNAQGEATALGGVCANGIDTIEAPINVKNRTKVQCIEYKMFEQVTEDTRSCISESYPTYNTVATSITEPDLYSLDERCVRTNNTEEARPSVQTVFSYKTRGFFKTSITKALIDETEISYDLNVSSAYLQAMSFMQLGDVNLTIEPSQIPEQPEAVYCGTTFPDSYNTKRSFLLSDTYPNKNDSIIGYLPTLNPSQATEKCRVGATIVNGRCERTLPACPSDTTYNTTLDVCEHTGYNFPTSEVKPFTCSDYLRDKNICYEDKWYNMPMIAVGTDKATCSGVSTQTGLTINTLGNVFWGDYDFAKLGISTSQIANKELCVVAGNTIVGDAMFSSIKDEGSDSVTFITKSAKNEADCTQMSECFSGKLNTTYANSTETKICSFLAGAEDLAPADEGFKLTGDTKINKAVFVENEGTYLSEINGYSDIFSVQEYTDGDFGYIVNHLFIPPKNNIVKLDNKEISPIFHHETATEDLLYKYDAKKTTIIVKNRKPEQNAPYTRGLMTFYPQEIIQFVNTGLFGQLGESDTVAVLATLTVGAAAAFSLALVVTFTSLLLLAAGASIAAGVVAIAGAVGAVSAAAAVAAPIAAAVLLVVVLIMLFQGTIKLGEYKNHYEVYKEIPTRYVENVYGYDERVKEGINLVYARLEQFSGTMKNGDYETYITNVNSEKTIVFHNQGYSQSMITQRMTVATETGPLGWNKIEWYEMGAIRRNNLISTGTNDISKELNTVYLGAVNNVAIVVPYKGEYEVIAYDKDNNVLGNTIVSDFNRNGVSSEGNPAQSYAQVKFAVQPSFNIATGMDREFSTGGCTSSSFVEWGGGVSGSYYENRPPDISGPCNKSVDTYVKEHSATKITVRAVDSAMPFVVKLKKPMPYANRVVLITMDQLENREYECWSEIAPCGVLAAEGAIE